MAKKALCDNSKYAIFTQPLAWYYQWDHTHFKIGIVHNANFELCVIPLVIPSRDGTIGIVHNANFELCVIPLVIPSRDGIIGIM